MKFILICIFSISYASSLIAIREEVVGDTHHSVFENRARAWQGLRRTENRQEHESALLRNIEKQNDAQVAPVKQRKINKI